MKPESEVTATPYVCLKDGRPIFRIQGGTGSRYYCDICGEAKDRVAIFEGADLLRAFTSDISEPQPDLSTIQ